MSFWNRSWKSPTEQNRVAISGRTGTGKTAFGLALLYVSNIWRKQPFVIIDYKRDPHISSLRIPDIKNWNIPEEPGLYRVFGDPFLTEDDPVENYLKSVWQASGIGLFFDEAYMLPDRFGRRGDGGVLRALFTTGRARNIPIISITQRPVDVTRYNFSEADYHAIFHLNDRNDRAKVKERVNENAYENFLESPKPFSPFWYDVSNDRSYILAPSPEPQEIVRLFNDAHKNKQNWI